MTPEQKVTRIDELLSHVWMVRTFIKHSDEAKEDDELTSIYRELYDCLLAVGPPLAEQNWSEYLKVVRKKFTKLRAATDLYCEIQPDVSEHTNFKMAARSLKIAVDEMSLILNAVLDEEPA